MKTRIIEMPAHLEPDVRDLYAVCHPNWPALPEPHFFAYPTLIAIAEYPYNVAGYTSYSMNVANDSVLALRLLDTGVAPEARGQGIASALMAKRLEVGRAMGARYAFGMTQPENEPMLKLLRSFGFHELQTIPRAYPAGETGVIFNYYFKKEN